MNKFFFLFLVGASTFSHAQSYAPAAGQPGSTAIAYDNPIFVGWASHIEVHRGYINITDTSAVYNGSNRATFGVPANAIGPASNISTETVSLGDSGIAIVTFDTPIQNGTGPDFAVFENGVTDNFLELAHVEVSSDGINYVRFPSHSETQTDSQIGSFGTVDPTYLYNLAGKYRAGFGTPFDLEELKDSLNLDVNAITHVKIIDVVGSIGPKGTLDSYGNKINDLFPTPFNTGGFDLAGIGVIHQQSLDVHTEKLNFSVYPNPSQGQINIQLYSPADELFVVNNLGQQIKYISIKQTTSPILFDLPQGIYFIHLKYGNQLIHQKVVVQ